MLLSTMAMVRNREGRAMVQRIRWAYEAQNDPQVTVIRDLVRVTKLTYLYWLGLKIKFLRRYHLEEYNKIQSWGITLKK